MTKNGKHMPGETYDYRTPVIPEGFVFIEGEWNTGFVIKNESDSSEFVWIPVGYLDPDGTLDGEHFGEKFGRRPWNCLPEELNTKFYEGINEDFVNSVQKYGGFYFARYLASEHDGKAVSIKGMMPWVNIIARDAEKAAAEYAKDSKDVVSLITSGAAFDSVLAWFIKSGAKTRASIVESSKSWGNHSVPYRKTTLRPTGTRKAWSVCNIYDVAGNVCEWTSELTRRYSRNVMRSGDYFSAGTAVDYSANAAARCYYNDLVGEEDEGMESLGFRFVLYLK